MLDDKYLIRRIQSYVDHGINSADGDVTNVRQSMFSQYMGELYGNERDGYSKYVSREVLQIVEWALPALLRVFTGGVKAVEFKPSGPQDEQQAKHETDIVNYWFYDGNEESSGFLTLYTFIKDILLYPNGYVRVSVEEDTRQDVEQFEGLTTEQLDALDERMDDVTSYEIDKRYTAGGVIFHDITVTTEKISKRIVVQPIAPDSCIIAHDHHMLDVDKAAFTCVREQKTRSQLREEGYSAAELENLNERDNDTWNSENVNRHFYVDEQPHEGDDAFDTEADEKFWVHECYMRVDYDEDGISELRRVVMAGTQILENEPIDFNPVVAASAIHVTHKHIGMGYAEIVADLQELMSTLIRQLLDNIYKQNVQRRFINESALLSDNSTMDQLLDGRSENIIVRGDPNMAVSQEQGTPIVAEIGAVIQQFGEQPQLRTGVAPQLSLDPSVLEKSTMGAFMGALDQASQRLELLARMFAETALKKVFQKIHYLLRTYFNESQQVQIGGKWVETNPSKWRRRSNMSVNVGLGFNNKQAMLGLLAQLLSIQKEALANGLADPAKIYATLEKMIEHANIGHVGTYFNDPTVPEFKAPPAAPDPQMLLAQAQADALRAEIARKDNELQAKTKLDTDTLAANIARDKETAEVKAAELNLKLMSEKRAEREYQLKVSLGDAQITELNTRATKNGGVPADTSADDEFARGERADKGKKDIGDTNAAT
jgi:hypothetical protein